jgi:hydroxymethylpyrimidine pyrophosphatase-like HAD family hydrolase
MELASSRLTMRYVALATDYDGTLAKDGTVDDATLDALRRLKESGRRLIMVSGRRLDDLRSVFSHLDLFDAAVLENGALLHRPADRSTTVLAEAPPPAFLKAMRKRDLPFVSGEVIVATWEEQAKAVLEIIQEMGLEMQVIFNKGSVMVLPSGVNKGTGLAAALTELGLSAHNVVGVGDAENDHAFLAACECAVAVDNALPAVKERADIVTAGARGEGVVELIDQLLQDDLRKAGRDIRRHDVLLGELDGGGKACIDPFSTRVVIAGPSGSGKSKSATGLIERIAAAGYQFCLIDPEGDYETFENAVRLGDPRRVPTVEEVLQVLAQPGENAIVNLLGVKLDDRPAFFGSLVPALVELRLRTGRPHWLIVDEAHHVLPAERDPDQLGLPNDFQGVMLVTVHVDRLAPAAIEPATIAIAVGDDADHTLRSLAKAAGEEKPKHFRHDLHKGEVALWDRAAGKRPVRVSVELAQADHRRHKRKYALGELQDDECFYFRGADGKLNLKAQNLVLFAQIARGLDDETWLHHLRQGDYSRWFKAAIKDKKLAAEAAGVERAKRVSASRSRERILDAIDQRYTLPA